MKRWEMAALAAAITAGALVGDAVGYEVWRRRVTREQARRRDAWWARLHELQDEIAIGQRADGSMILWMPDETGPLMRQAWAEIRAQQPGGKRGAVERLLAECPEDTVWTLDEGKGR